jgi:hypothetical protein
MNNKMAEMIENTKVKYFTKQVRKEPESRVLAFSCLHAPYNKKGSREFVKGVYDKYHCNKIVCCGDEVDLHALSYHEHSPDLCSAGDELQLAINEIHRWEETFPKMLLCESNHGSLPYRKAKTAGIPKNMIKNYNDIYGVGRGWKWGDKWEIDGVEYSHQGTSQGGKMPHLDVAIPAGKSSVIGHFHSVFGVDWFANEEKCIFGACCGSLVDRKHLSMAYGKLFKKKPILGCIVVIGGETVIPIRMEL